MKINIMISEDVSKWEHIKAQFDSWGVNFVCFLPITNHRVFIRGADTEANKIVSNR